MPKGDNGDRSHRSFLRVNSSVTRLCLMPERRPGVAPACADDNIQAPGDYVKGKPVTLPRVKWLEGRK